MCTRTIVLFVRLSVVVGSAAAVCSVHAEAVGLLPVLVAALRPSSPDRCTVQKKHVACVLTPVHWPPSGRLRGQVAAAAAAAALRSTDGRTQLS